MTEVTKETAKRTVRTGARKNTPKVEEVQEVQAEQVATLVEEAPMEEAIDYDKTFGIIAVDNGGDNVKVINEDMDEPISFKAYKKIGMPRNIQETALKDNMETHSFVIQWNDKVYLTNHRTSLVWDENMTGYVNSKATDYFILSALLAVALYGYDTNYLVTSVPSDHKHDDKVKQRLLGHHKLIIDDEVYEFEISNVVLALEAQAGHVYIQEEGITTMLEIGSRTVNYATNELIFNEDGSIARDQPIWQKTGTIAKKGVELTKFTNVDYEVYVNSVFTDLAKRGVTEDDRVIAFGGGVLIDEIKETLTELFEGNISFHENPLYVQVLGMLEIGRLTYNAEYGDDSE